MDFFLTFLMVLPLTTCILSIILSKNGNWDTDFSKISGKYLYRYYSWYKNMHLGELIDKCEFRWIHYLNNVYTLISTKRCLQWYIYCMIWIPSVHLYSHLQLMRCFHIFLTLSLFQRKKLWLTMLYILPKVTSSEIMASSLKPSYFDSKIYVLSSLLRRSFFPWKHLY